jgi:hypothetical protein
MLESTCPSQWKDNSCYSQIQKTESNKQKKTNKKTKKKETKINEFGEFNKYTACPIKI